MDVMDTPADSLNELKARLQSFTQSRDWGQFHSPKNLSSALAVEAAELLEHFQWMTEEQSRNLTVEKKALVAFEMADVMCYLLHLSNELSIDLIEVTREKIEINESRFPVDQVRGKA